MSENFINRDLEREVELQNMKRRKKAAWILLLFTVAVIVAFIGVSMWGGRLTKNKLQQIRLELERQATEEPAAGPVPSVTPQPVKPNEDQQPTPVSPVPEETSSIKTPAYGAAVVASPSEEIYRGTDGIWRNRQLKPETPELPPVFGLLSQITGGASFNGLGSPQPDDVETEFYQDADGVWRNRVKPSQSGEASKLANIIGSADPQALSKIVGDIDPETLSRLFGGVDPKVISDFANGGDPKALSAILGGMDPQALSTILEKADPKALSEALKNVDSKTLSQLLSGTDSGSLSKLIEGLDANSLVGTLAGVDPEVLSGLLGGMDPNAISSVLGSIDSKTLLSLTEGTDLSLVSSIIDGLGTNAFANLSRLGEYDSSLGLSTPMEEPALENVIKIPGVLNSSPAKTVNAPVKEGLHGYEQFDPQSSPYFKSESKS